MEASPSREIYLDNNATTCPLPEVREAMLAVLGDRFGNPSSVHEAGERARQQLREARASVAALLMCDPGQIIFTSSGTEASNLVFRSMAERPQPRFATTATEHSSILKMVEHLGGRGAHVEVMPVDRAGHIKLEALEAVVRNGMDLVSVQWVNNETGVIQPIEQIGRICREHGALFHTDAAQAMGKLRVDVEQLPIDFLSLTGHKLHGPLGAAALWARDLRVLSPLFYGGAQEEGLRAGTENLPSIVGLGKAAELRAQRLGLVCSQIGDLRDRFERSLTGRIPGLAVNGEGATRVCNTSNLRFPRIDGEAMVARLDQAGIRCSQSSACTNQRTEPSYVLRAMGLSEAEAYASIRFSFSELNTPDEVDQAVEQIAELWSTLRAFHAAVGVSS